MKRLFNDFICFFALTVLTFTVFTGCGGNESGEKKFSTYRLYLESESPSPYMLSDGKVIGVLFNTVKPFCGVEVPVSVLAEGENSVTLSVYGFDTDYKTTLGSIPEVKTAFNNVSDGEVLFFGFASLPAGQYVITVGSDSSDIGLSGLAPIVSLENRVSFYYQYSPVANCAFGFSVIYRSRDVGVSEVSDILANIVEQAPVAVPEE